MNAGKLNHRITVQSKTAAADTYGGETITWTTFATVWASIEPLRGNEFIESQRAGAELTTRIRVRYRSGYAPTMRVTWGTHVYDVEAVINVNEAGRETQLMCREVIRD